MKLKQKKNLKKRRGFTLVELVIVIAILGVLGSIGFANFNKVQANSKEKADYITASNIASAVKLAISEGETFEDGNVNLQTLESLGYLENKPVAQSGDAFTANIGENDKVIINLDGEQIYPKQGAQ